MLIQCQYVGRLTTERKSIISLLEDERPSRLKTPEPDEKAYRTGALNFESIDSKSVRVESAPERVDFCQA